MLKNNWSHFYIFKVMDNDVYLEPVFFKYNFVFKKYFNKYFYYFFFISIIFSSS